MSIFTSIFDRKVVLLFFFYLTLPTISYSYSIDFDAATGNYVIEYFSEDLNKEVVVVFEPPTKIDPKISSKVDFIATDTFKYWYSVKNSGLAKQDLFSIGIPLETAPSSSTAPVGWNISYPTPQYHFVSFWPISERGGSAIVPNAEPLTFSITTHLLPDILKFRFEGQEITHLAYPDEPPEDVSLAVLDIEREDKNSFVGLLSVGPSSFTFTDAAIGIDRLISLKHQSASLGWLTGEKFTRELDHRLEKAKRALARSMKFLARVYLNQFIRDLEHQKREQEKNKKHGRGDRDDDRHGHDRDRHHGHGKTFLSDNAYYLLKPNAEFIVSKLPAKARGRDEERECGRAEKEYEDEEGFHGDRHDNKGDDGELRGDRDDGHSDRDKKHGK